MKQILSLDFENRMATVEPGVVNLHLTQAAKKKNFYYAPDPSSQMVPRSAAMWPRTPEARIR